QSFAPQSPLITRALSLYEGIRLMSFRDRFASEQAMIEFLLEYERACYSSPQSDALMEDVRRRVLRHAGLGVEELADERGMSRSNYSHYFKATTGVSPALFMRQVRLEESARRLLQTDQKLEHIARETGFANANHFCKAFRQRYHLRPGEFRRQLR
ncbi:MAG TPA: helix-turn-helix transcriptional regulator, partial [Abditibacteriaceae bacterium]